MRAPETSTSLALEAWELARSQLLAHLRFMGTAFSRLRLLPLPGTTLATDGANIRFDPARTLAVYQAQSAGLARDYLHIVLHNVFLHPFADPSLNASLWDAAADIAVEAAIDDLALPFLPSTGKAARDATLAPLRAALPLVSAEAVYKRLREEQQAGRLTDESLEALRAPFLHDDHAPWHAPRIRETDAVADTAEEGSAGAENHDHARGPAVQTPKPGEDGIAMPFPEDARHAERKRASHQAMDSEDVFQKDAPQEAHATQAGRFADTVTLDRARDQWKEVAYETGVQLDSYRKLWGAEGSQLSMALRHVTRKRRDYRAFLRKFSRMGEAMRVNDDEFDYVFYTFGLRKYGNLPLIEPLEFAEERRIRTLVIAIDTSASTKDGLVRQFLERTWSILADEAAFFKDMRVLVLQCDAAVTRADVIESRRDLDDYVKDLRVEGLGGTDFRPVFAYVDNLLERGELSDLGGLLYFTDGHGTFPSRKPAYRTAFVLADDLDEVVVPPWALKVVLDDEAP